eukprot:280112-Pelagomonas_calceolata.AAC.5
MSHTPPAVVRGGAACCGTGVALAAAAAHAWGAALEADRQGLVLRCRLSNLTQALPPEHSGAPRAHAHAHARAHAAPAACGMSAAGRLQSGGEAAGRHVCVCACVNLHHDVP